MKIVKTISYSILLLVFIAICVAWYLRDPRDEMYEVPGFEAKEKALREKYPENEFYTEEEIYEMKKDYESLIEEKIKKADELERRAKRESFE